MTCCSNAGEILVVPRGLPPSHEATSRLDEQPLPGAIVSSFDELFMTSAEDMPASVRGRLRSLRSRPYVAVVPE